MNIDLFLPAYNEELIVEKHIHIISTFVRQHFKKDKVAIVVVDDNSTDKTLLLLRKLQKKHKNLRIAHFSKGPSRRENLSNAMKDSKADIVMFMDFDLATDINSLPRLVEEVKKGADIATGSRYMKNSLYRILRYIHVP